MTIQEKLEDITG